YLKTAQISRPGPAQAFVFMDESDCTLNTGAFFVSDIEASVTHPAIAQMWYGHYPAFRHGRSASVSFADGHCELHRWVDPQLDKLQKTNPEGMFLPYNGLKTGRDLQWVRDRFVYPP